MAGLKKKIQKSFKKTKPVFKKSKKFAKRTTDNIEEYFMEDARQARKLKPRFKRKIEFNR